MWAAASIALVLLAAVLLRVSLFLSGVCWIALYFMATRAENETRENRFFPWVIVAAAVTFLIDFGRWAWHVLRH